MLTPLLLLAVQADKIEIKTMVNAFLSFMISFNLSWHLFNFEYKVNIYHSYKELRFVFSIQRMFINIYIEIILSPDFMIFFIGINDYAIFISQSNVRAIKKTRR